MVKSCKTIEGKVVDITTSFNKLCLIINQDDKEKEVELPVKIRNDFELIPYQISLLEQKINFKKTYEEIGNCGMTNYTKNETVFVLKILSGPLKGKKYSFTNF